MNEQIDTLNRHKLTQLMGLSAQAPTVWSDAELAQVLRLQLQARIADEFQGAWPEDAKTGPAFDRSSLENAGTFLDLLQSPEPSGAMLRWAKGFFKQLSRSEPALIPEPVCRMLYYAVVAVAARHDIVGISKLSQEEQAAGISWVLSRSWLDERLGAILGQADGA